MIPYDLPPWIFAIFLFVYGAVLGSFLTVCVHRLPQHVSNAEYVMPETNSIWAHFVADIRMLWPDWPALWRAWGSLGRNPSHCDRCQKKLLARDNLPIIGWLMRRGRCRFCLRRIPAKYPLIELANGLLFVVTYWMEVPIDRYVGMAQSCLTTHWAPDNLANGFGNFPVAMVNVRWLYHLILIETLLVASLIDWDLMIIPDSVTLPSLAVGLIGSATFAKLWLVPVWFQDTSIVRTTYSMFTGKRAPEWISTAKPEWIATYPHWHGLAVSLAGLIIGGMAIWVIRLIGQWALQREAMGFGDVVLMSMVGSFLGWQPTLIAICLSSFLAVVVVVGTRMMAWDREFPYGPFLSLGTLITVLFWKWIWRRAELYFSLGPFLLLVGLVLVVGLCVTLLLVKGIKERLGFAFDADADWGDEWTSADQLSHFAGETVDPQQGRWPAETWPGAIAARGQRHETDWRRPAGSGWNQQWQRRDPGR